VPSRDYPSVDNRDSKIISADRKLLTPNTRQKRQADARNFPTNRDSEKGPAVCGAHGDFTGTIAPIRYERPANAACMIGVIGRLDQNIGHLMAKFALGCSCSGRVDHLRELRSTDFRRWRLARTAQAPWRLVLASPAPIHREQRGKGGAIARVRP
jgi:hypothetical protein